MKLFISFVIFIYTTSVMAYEHIRPVPTMPNLQTSLSQISDTITYSLVAQIHRGLFKIGKDSVPVPDLAESFEVKEKGLVYLIKIKEGLKFHKGQEFNEKVTVASLKNALLSNDEHLAKKFGLGKILKAKKKPGKNNRWVRISSKDTSSVEIELSHKNPKLIYFLSDPRMSISIRNSINNGLGSYRITSKSDDRIQLERVTKKDETFANTITYVKASEKKAITLFKKGEAHDLSLYSLGNNEFKSIARNAKVQKTLFPKTYAFFINAKRNNLEQRKAIAKILMESEVASQCRFSQSKENSFIPKGFPGHSPMSKPVTASRLKKKIIVMIPKEVGKEECVKSLLDKNKAIEVKMVDFSVVAKSWLSDKIDVFYGFVEGESDFSFFEHFIPSSTFPLGDKNDKLTHKLYDQLTDLEEINDKHRVSDQLAKHLNNQYYFVPVYSPVVEFALNQNIALDQTAMQAPYQMDLSQARKLR